MARKRKRKGLGALGFIVIVAILGLLYTVVSGDRPLLGLDLQGGVSVVLKPRDADVPAANLEQAKRIIDKRINALGVAESEVTTQGNTILVQIPGVKDKDRALKLVGQTAELQFRPVLATYPPPSDSSDSSDSTDTTAADGSTDSTATTVDPSATTCPTTTRRDVDEPAEHGWTVEARARWCPDRHPASRPHDHGRSIASTTTRRCAAAAAAAAQLTSRR
jgi:preprotein translocase subunit SecD